MKVIALKLKHTIWFGSFCLAVFLPLKSQALTIQEVPNPRQVNSTWVTDMAGILDDSTEAQLNSEIAQLEAKKGTEIAVVTVPETAPSASPKEFATALFHYWGIGKKGKDNGVLLLISKGDRRVEIETGYGIEPILPDAKVGNIIDTKITPRFKQGDFNGGTLAGTKALVVALEAPQSSSALQEPTPTAIATSTPKTTLTAQPVALEQEPTPGANVPLGVLVGGGLVLAIGAVALRSRKVLLEPEGDSRFRGSNRVCLCANCKKRMVKVDNTTIEPTLSKAEQVAQQLGSVRFEGWKCPNCSQQLTGLGFHRVAYESHSGQFCECPTCEELTVTRTQETLKHPTEYSTGTRLITDECHCCDYRQEREETIPCLPPPSPPSSSSSSSSSSGSSSSGGDSSGSSSSGGDSGGGSFGGGDSGGGGAGGSW